MARMAWHGMDPYLTTRPLAPLLVGPIRFSAGVPPLVERSAQCRRCILPSLCRRRTFNLPARPALLSRESTVVPRFCQPGASDAPGRPADPRLFSWPWALRYARYTSESGDLNGGEKIEGHMTAPFWWWPAEFAGCYPLGPASSSRHVLVLRGENKHTQARDEWRRDGDAVSPSWECRRRWLPLGEFIHASHLSSSCAARGAMRPASARSTVVSGGVVVVVGINQPWNGCGCVGAGGCMRMRQPQQGEKIGPTPRWGSNGASLQIWSILWTTGRPRGEGGGPEGTWWVGSFWVQWVSGLTPRLQCPQLALPELPLTHVQSHVLHRTICTSADNPRLDGTQYPRTHPPISAYAPIPPSPPTPPSQGTSHASSPFSVSTVRNTVEWRTTL